MRLARETVALDADAYRRYVELMRHQREILRCVTALDISGIRRVWGEMSPHLDQPESDWEALRIMHEARVRMKSISPQQKRYSEQWLRDLENKVRVAASVGVAVKSFSSANRERAAHVQMAMSEAVAQAVKDGVDIELEVAEVHRRMKVASDAIRRR